MDPSEVWNEICFLLYDRIDENISEKEFEHQVVRFLEVLGWSEFKGEIKLQQTMQVGRKNSIRPDVIVFSSEEKPLIVLEIKRPKEDIDKSDAIDQLKSYMRLMQCEFGFLIGSQLGIYYDGAQKPQKDLFLLEKIPFNPDHAEGKVFVENFNKSSFLNKSYDGYLNSKLNKFNREQLIANLTDQLVSKNTRLRIEGLLERDYAEWGEEIFNSALRNVTIEIRRSPVPVPSAGAESLPRKPIQKKLSVETKPKSQVRAISERSDNVPDFNSISFDHTQKTKLKHIYAVLYFMKRRQKFSKAVKSALDRFKPSPNHPQTIEDKCARGFAGSAKAFVDYFEKGDMLDRLQSKFNLSEDDYEKFQRLLET